MSFNIALSGIATSQTDINTTANNIANSNTYGFKESRAEFADVFASSIFGAGKTKVGDGASTAVVAQQFQQGSLIFTKNALDLAVTGNGFFAVTDGLESREMSYTRAGNFKLDEDNFVVSNGGNYLQVYPVNEDGTSQGVSLSTTSPLRIPDSAGVPQASSEIDMTMNLDAREAGLDPALFDPTDDTTFHARSSITVYDSLGASHIMTTYYVKSNQPPTTAGETEWYAFATIDTDPGTGQPYPLDLNAIAPGGGYTQVTAAPTGAIGDGDYVGVPISFNSSGIVTRVNGYQPGIDPEPFVQTQTFASANFLTNGADGGQQITIDYDAPTQFASDFEVTALEQDGATVGRLTGVTIDETGLVSANYSNGTVDNIGRIALVRFANDQGLQQIGDTSWKESLASGEPLAGEAGSGTFGDIRSSALEQSNVDLTKELVDLITAQKAFQANSRSLDVNSQLQQTILGIR
ncbi:flagellar hook protein FlgE [Catenovulum sp. SM1970]|uniref:flagellar hook protein FlgE n=1 Tax=Marinifaba aquimaris TaxID=2741323 RepID=UPI0015722EF9|nr:flagellar hook protein FlgE [Marinifaba aquimaris]NTS75401.1 flagellar hook protein FlgE [Marinifaba aquimaris]